MPSETGSDYDDEGPESNEGSEEEELEEWEVEDLLEHRDREDVDEGKYVSEFLVKWKPTKGKKWKPTWEPEENILDQTLIARFWKRENAKQAVKSSARAGSKDVSRAPSPAPKRKPAAAASATNGRRAKSETKEERRESKRSKRAISVSDDEEEIVEAPRKRKKSAARERSPFVEPIKPKTPKKRAVSDESETDDERPPNRASGRAAANRSASPINRGGDDSSQTSGEVYKVMDELPVKLRYEKHWDPLLKRVETMVNADSGETMVFVMWKDGGKSVHPLPEIRLRCPQTLIDFFVSKIKFKPKSEKKGTSTNGDE
ncbi:hypothetical protein DFJ74DRAFT_356626 [Hyaloraphidium curvatum]|nr:hypothetical protein DFJ74DRAFT_356626 [Hyaloraphidium curvatum]